MKTGIELIVQERKEQIEKHGRTVEQDIELNTLGQLIKAARILTTETPSLKPPKNWNRAIWIKMATKPYADRLVISGALIAAEIDRLLNPTTEQDK